MDFYQNYQEALAIWKKMTSGHRSVHRDVDLSAIKKLRSIFHIGPYYYYIFDLPTGQFLHIDPAIQEVLGIEPDELSTTEFIAKIHPQDVVYFLNFEKKVSEFFAQLSYDQVMKYKVSYDLRIKTKEGDYKRILQQVITINQSNEGHVLQTLGVHTDISHVKNAGEPRLSFIGLEGEPSYIDVDYQKAFDYKLDTFSKREKEIMQYLCEGANSAEIASMLCISDHTVRTHRKNILKKAGVNSTAKLTAKAIEKGWV